MEGGRPNTQINKTMLHSEYGFAGGRLSVCRTHSVLDAQVNQYTFQCDLYEVPLPVYVPNAFPRKHFEIDDPDVKLHRGVLDVNLSTALMRKGSFKTAHPGTILFQGEANPFTDGKVCVKQIYEQREDDKHAIVRLKGRDELEKLSIECNCLKWASILLDLTYQFVDREVKKRGKPPLPIPELHFPCTMIAIVRQYSKEKVFLIEEWFNLDSGDQFDKYLGNCFPESSLSHTASPKAHEIAAFLLFAQHVQWEKTRALAFTSDYQGAGDILTDPQITSNPSVLPIFCFFRAVLLTYTSKLGHLFGPGNLPAAFVDFRTYHTCNAYCKFFELKLDNVTPDL